MLQRPGPSFVDRVLTALFRAVFICCVLAVAAALARA